MAGKQSIVYWDSSAFLALLKPENHGPGVLDALVSQAGAFDRAEITLVTSTIGIMEVLSAEISDAVRDRFESMIKRSNFQLVTANEGVARSAAILRKHCYTNGKSRGLEKYIISPADAIHVTSAMVVKSDILITLDSRNKARKQELAMTAVSDFYPIAGLHSVRIERPSTGLPGVSMF